MRQTSLSAIVAGLALVAAPAFAFEAKSGGDPLSVSTMAMAANLFAEMRNASRQGAPGMKESALPRPSPLGPSPNGGNSAPQAGAGAPFAFGAGAFGPAAFGPGGLFAAIAAQAAANQASPLRGGKPGFEPTRVR